MRKDATRFRHANEREEATAELLNIASDWLVRMGAARLAGIAMERHRQRQQDPVIASDVSTLLYDGDRRRLRGRCHDYDSGDQPVLKGLRANGERVALEAMAKALVTSFSCPCALQFLPNAASSPCPS